MGALYPFFRHVGNRGGVVFLDDFPALAIDMEFGIEVLALPFMGDEPIETRTRLIVFLTHMPFANVRCLVARLLEGLWKAFQLRGILRKIVHNSVRMRIETTEETGSTR